MKSIAWHAPAKVQRAPVRLRRHVEEQTAALDTALQVLAVAITVVMLLVGLNVWTARLGPTMFKTWSVAGDDASLPNPERELSHVP